MQRCAAITTEFENVPAARWSRWAHTGRWRRPPMRWPMCQDRIAEKAHFRLRRALCAVCGDRHARATWPPCPTALLPGILKTARLGYDGKGQVRVADRAALAAAWAALGGVPCVLEQRCRWRHELSVIVARGADGTMVQLPVQQNLHRDGILAVTQVPAPDRAPRCRPRRRIAAR
jgi:5-(carboxyamino)imidazole ribonucleotide synthase